tara:strand:- start:6776 stop:8605 length:1830 start_codon:yes stop_codon:yes gene_type:complete
MQILNINNKCSNNCYSCDNIENYINNQNKQIIDFHTHISLNKLPQILYKESANINDLQDEMKENNITHSVILADYTKTKKNQITNKKLIELTKDMKNIFRFGSLDIVNNFEQGFDELKKLINEKQLQGIKLYPGYQEFYPDDNKINILYNFAEYKNIPIMFHSGYQASKNKLSEYSHPRYINNVAKRFPKLRIIIAHLGFPWHEETKKVILSNKKVYTDISGLMISIKKTPEEKIEIIAKKLREFIISISNFEKILFGSDFPIRSIEDSIKIVEKMNFPHIINRKILFLNAYKVLFEKTQNPFLNKYYDEKKIKSIQIETTYDCNTNCNYCYNKFLDFKRKNVLSWEKFVKIINKAKESDILEVNFMGGEPTLWLHIEEGVKLIKEKGLCSIIFSNGLKKLKNVPDIFIMHLTDKTLENKENINYYKKQHNQKKIKVFIATFPIFENMNENKLHKIKKTIIKDFQRVIINIGFPYKNTKKLGKLLFDTIKYFIQYNIKVRIVNPIPLCILTQDQINFLKNNKVQFGGFCIAGLRPTIEPDGETIRPCEGLQIKTNLNLNKLKNFNEIKELFIEKIQTTRYNLPLECKNCNYFKDKKCQNGCLVNRFVQK